MDMEIIFQKYHDIKARYDTSVEKSKTLFMKMEHIKKTYAKKEEKIRIQLLTRHCIL